MNQNVYIYENQVNRENIVNSFINMLTFAFPDYIFTGEIEEIDGGEMIVISYLAKYSGFTYQQSININLSSNSGVIRDIFKQFDLDLL